MKVSQMYNLFRGVWGIQIWW